MKISEDTIEYVAALAKLKLEEDQKEKTIADLNRILTYIDTMNELDTDGIEPMSHALELKNALRDDVVTKYEDTEATLANTAVKTAGCCFVQTTVEIRQSVRAGM